MDGSVPGLLLEVVRVMTEKVHFHTDRDLERELDAAEAAMHDAECDCFDCWPDVGTFNRADSDLPGDYYL